MNVTDDSGPDSDIFKEAEQYLSQIPRWDRWRSRLSGRGLTLLTGVVLVTTGVICLYLSDAVARTGSWWQSTLDAFGVGLVVGGLVDVAAISLLNQFLVGYLAQQQRTWSYYAKQLIDMAGGALEAVRLSYNEDQDLLPEGRFPPGLSSEDVQNTQQRIQSLGKSVPERFRKPLHDQASMHETLSVLLNEVRGVAYNHANSLDVQMNAQLFETENKLNTAIRLVSWRYQLRVAELAEYQKEHPSMRHDTE
jgi:hypothetical protein